MSAGEAQPAKQEESDPQLLQDAAALKLKVELVMLRHEVGGLHKMLTVARAGQESTPQPSVEECDLARAEEQVGALLLAAEDTEEETDSCGMFGRELQPVQMLATASPGDDLSEESPDEVACSSEQKERETASAFMAVKSVAHTTTEAATVDCTFSWSSSKATGVSVAVADTKPQAEEAPRRWRRRLRKRSANADAGAASAAFETGHDILSQFMGSVCVEASKSQKVAAVGKGSKVEESSDDDASVDAEAPCKRARTSMTAAVGGA